MKDSLFNITLDNLSGSMMLTVEPKEEMVINDFCCEMIKKTNVYGLLKLNVTTINGSIKFNYDLSKKKSIAEYAKTGFNESYGMRILYNLCNAFLKLNEYYLKPNYCLLNPEYTYVGDGLNVYLPYIPVKDIKSDNDELKAYFSELLSRYFAVEGIAAYDEMFKYVYQCQNFDLSFFVSKFLSSEEQSQNNFVAEKQERMANKMPLPSQEPIRQVPPQVNPANNQPKPINVELNKSPKASAGEMKIPGGGDIKVPGLGAMKIPGGGEIKLPGGGNEPQKIEGEKKGVFGIGNKILQHGFQSKIQGNMNKTIMIDDMNMSQQTNNMTYGNAFLQYRGQNIPINDNEFVIGKANNQYKINFAINDNPHVSRKHASIIAQGNSYYIRDEGSTNGTYVNGRSLPKMVPQPLQNGDEISIYDEVFIFCM